MLERYIGVGLLLGLAVYGMLLLYGLLLNNAILYPYLLILIPDFSLSKVKGLGVFGVGLYVLCVLGALGGVIMFVLKKRLTLNVKKIKSKNK